MEDEEYEKYARVNCFEHCPANKIIRYYETEYRRTISDMCRYAEAFCGALRDVEEKKKEPAMEEFL